MDTEGALLTILGSFSWYLNEKNASFSVWSDDTGLQNNRIAVGTYASLAQHLGFPTFMVALR